MVHIVKKKSLKFQLKLFIHLKKSKQYIIYNTKNTKRNASAGNRTRVQRLEGVDAATIPLMLIVNCTTTAGFEPAPRYQE